MQAGEPEARRDANHPRYLEGLVRFHMRNLTLMGMNAALGARDTEESAKLGNRIVHGTNGWSHSLF